MTIDKSESQVLKEVLEVLNKCGFVKAMRNNVGAIKKGSRYIKYGLGVGSADVVAIVGPYGRWVCIECKRPKNPTEEAHQREWLQRMQECGAVAGVVRSAEEALELIKQARSWRT